MRCRGVSFSGGVGTVFGVVTGVIIFTVINYGLTYIGVNPYWQYIIKGGIIIFAVALDSLKYARKVVIQTYYFAYQITRRSETARRASYRELQR